MQFRSLLPAVFALTLVAASGGVAAPVVLPGWPVAAPSGSVDEGPGGGPVVTGEVLVGGPEYPDVAAVAYRRNGTRRWMTTVGSCIECGGFRGAPRQADGTYGPFLLLPSFPYPSPAIDRNGVIVSGCTGTVQSDGTCTSVRPVVDESGVSRSPGEWRLSSSRGATTLWTYTELAGTFDVNSSSAIYGVPNVVADGTGTVYSTYGYTLDATDHSVRSRVLALDAATGTRRWLRSGNFRVLAGLTRGVVVADGLDVAALRQDTGLELWRTPGLELGSGQVVVDTAHDRVYVTPRGSHSYSQGVGQVVVLDATTGAELWRTPGSDFTELLSIDGQGRPLVAVFHKKRYSLRALGVNGEPVWQFDTATRVVGAHDLSDGTVAVSLAARQRYFERSEPYSSPGPPYYFCCGGGEGLLARIDPARTAARVRRARVGLRGNVVRVRCDQRHCDLPGRSAILTMALPTPANVRVSVVAPRTLRPTKYDFPFTVSAPAGLSFVRILTRPSWAQKKTGRYRVKVEWHDRNGAHTSLFPVRFV